MLSQFKMNPDPAYQNRLLPERDNASFFDGYSVWFPVWIEKQLKEWQSD